MMVAVLPVKSPKNAKQRLRGFLSPEQRERLARTMYEHVLGTLCTARGIDRVMVATSDPDIAARAQSRGAEVLVEREQVSHSHSADRAAAHAHSTGATSVILLPIDVPLISSGDIESLVASAHHGLVVVPSSDGTGTNALVRTPPDAIQACFGPGSFRKHCDQAEARGIPLKVMRPPGILFDVDTPEDVAELLARAPECSAARYLQSCMPAAT